MRLYELTGVKKYKDATLDDVLRDYEAAGGQFLGAGKFASVIGHPSRDYVWKFFPNDACYISFIRWAIRNPAPFLPRVLSKPRWVIPFYKRHRTQSKIFVVKLEKLSPWNTTKLQAALATVSDAYDFSRFMEDTAYCGAYSAAEVDQSNAHQINLWGRVSKVYQSCPEVVELAKGYLVLLNNSVQCSLDMSTSNVMQRDDGTLVFTDPFWHGDSPYQDAFRAAIENNDMYPDENERDYVRGGELPKKKKKPKPYQPTNFDDLPF